MNIAGVLFLALIDSVNPSAIVVTLSLLAVARARVVLPVVVYIGAIFITYLALGVMMVLGIEALLPSLGDVLRSWPGLIAQSLVGLALLIYGLTGSATPPSSRVASPPSARTYAALVLLGITVTAMELPTAKRLAHRYAALKQRLESGARGTMLWVAGLVGGWLFVAGAIELVVRLR